MPAALRRPPNSPPHTAANQDRHANLNIHAQPSAYGDLFPHQHAYAFAYPFTQPHAHFHPNAHSATRCHTFPAHRRRRQDG